MKTSKLLIAASLAALGLSHLASGQTVIYLSGAPATRKIWNLAIKDLLIADSPGGTTINEYDSGTSINNANQILFTGGYIKDGSGNSYPVTIDANWSGSTGGNQSVAINPPQSNTALQIAYFPTNASGLTVGSGNAAPTGNKQYPIINLSDTQQATVPFNGHVTITSPATNYVALTEATPNSPAVTGFEFVVNKGAPSDLTNISTLQAQELFQSGEVPLSLLTGTTSDASIDVYAAGRDIASGARYALLAETGIGVANSNLLTQYEPTVSGGVIQTITNSNLAGYPSGGTINLISYPSGAGGYSSFTPVGTLLAATSGNTVGYVISYVTDSDAATAVGNGAKALTWNGVAYSATAIENGAYSYWTFLHVYYNNSLSATAPNSVGNIFANDLSSQLSTDTGTGALLSSLLQVQRLSDGQVITPPY